MNPVILPHFTFPDWKTFQHSPEHVDIWKVDIEAIPLESSEIDRCLSAEENQRGMAFHAEEHRKRFQKRRYLLRYLLGVFYLKTDPALLQFTSEKRGKPRVADSHQSTLHFNVSHSESTTLIAIANIRVGIDLEILRPKTDIPLIVTDHFSPNEVVLWQSTPSNQQTEVFYEIWTRKEAWLKAHGHGLTDQLAKIETLFPDALQGHHNSIQLSSGSETWHLANLAIDPQFTAALCLKDFWRPIRYFHLLHSSLA